MAANGPPIKFTPARFEQIRNLVERGMSREQIAETIGVTVGSLQVTCSRHGISLRRPKLNIWEHDPTTVLSPRSIVSTGEGSEDDLILEPLIGRLPPWRRRTNLWRKATNPWAGA